MPKIKKKEGKQDLINVIKDLSASGREDLANDLIKLVTRNGTVKVSSFGVLRFQPESLKTELRRIT